MNKKAIKKNKFKAVKTGAYDSKKESKRAAELRLLERAGKIASLAEQVPFVILEGFITKDGKKIRPIVYNADFVYYDLELKSLVIDDTKGTAKMYNHKGELCKSKTIIKDGKKVVKKAFTTATKDFLIKKKFVQKLYPDYIFLES